MSTNSPFYIDEGFNVIPDLATGDIKGYTLDITTRNWGKRRLQLTKQQEGMYSIGVYIKRTSGDKEDYQLDTDFPIDTHVLLEHECDHTPVEMLQVLRSYATLISVGFFDSIDPEPYLL